MSKKSKKLKSIIIGHLSYRDMTKQDLANCLNICLATLNNKLNGRTEFTVSELRHITDILKFTDEEKKEVI